MSLQLKRLVSVERKVVKSYRLRKVSVICSVTEIAVLNLLTTIWKKKALSSFMAPVLLCFWFFYMLHLQPFSKIPNRVKLAVVYAKDKHSYLDNINRINAQKNKKK